jgi:glycosyltransferase involved in cell wall biosynthesis
LQSYERGKHVYLLITKSFHEQLNEINIKISVSNVIYLPEFFTIEYDHRKLTKVKASFEALKYLNRLTKKENFKILHCVLPYFMLLPFLYLRNDKVKIAFSTVTAPQLLRPWNTIPGFLLRAYLMQSDMIDSLYGNLNVYSKTVIRKMKVCPCSFTDYARFLGNKNKDPLIVFAGELSLRKDPIFLLRAVVDIQDRLLRSGWKVAIYGKGPLEKKIVSFISQHGLENLVNVATTADMAAILNKSSIFCSCQVEENYPSQALLEAMASGNAVVATDVGETRRLVNGHNGLLVPKNSYTKLSQILLTLIENKDLRDHLGNAAAQHVRKSHTIYRFADYMLDFWESI